MILSIVKRQTGSKCLISDSIENFNRAVIILTVKNLSPPLIRKTAELINDFNMKKHITLLVSFANLCKN